MTVESKAAFARRLGCARSWVTQLAKLGRIVETPEGRVDVEASMARMEATKDPAHAAVAARHAADRGAVLADAPDARSAGSTPAAAATPGHVEADAEDSAVAASDPSFASWRTRRERAAALKAEQELDESAGRLMRRDEVLAAGATAAATLRTAADDWADHIAPTLVGQADASRIVSALRAGVHELLADYARRLEALAERAAA